MNLSLKKSDAIGALASGLCMIHCFATPFIFIVQSCSVSCCDAAPSWWKWIDYFFLAISFLAVYQTTKTTNKRWIKPALWMSWIALFLTIVNERLGWVALPEVVTYIAAMALVVLHLYNLRYCQCKEDGCCVHNQ